MPPDLTKAHQALDRAVDRLYRKKLFGSDTERLELLFERYRELTEATRGCPERAPIDKSEPVKHGLRCGARRSL
jgi:hypothetical protein